MNYKSYIVEQDLNSLKSKIVLFYGENLGFINEIKKKLKEKNTNVSFNIANQDEVLKDQEDFFQNFLNNSLFEDRKIFFIDQVSDKILNLIQEIEKRIDTQTIYLFANALEKKSKIRNYFEKSKELAIIACYNDNEIALRKKILVRLKDFSGLTTENIKAIIDSSNLDRDKLNNELDKIEVCFIDKKLNNTQLLQLLNMNENDDFNSLKDAALNGDTNKTNQLLSDTTIANEKIIFYLNFINQRLNKLRDILTSNVQLEKAIDIPATNFLKDKPNVLKQGNGILTKLDNF